MSIEILDYADAGHEKLVRSWSGVRGSTFLEGRLFLGAWKAAPAAINRLTLLPDAGNFVAGSRATLYGMSV